MPKIRRRNRARNGNDLPRGCLEWTCWWIMADPAEKSGVYNGDILASVLHFSFSRFLNTITPHDSWRAGMYILQSPVNCLFANSKYSISLLISFRYNSRLSSTIEINKKKKGCFVDGMTTTNEASITLVREESTSNAVYHAFSDTVGRLSCNALREKGEIEKPNNIPCYVRHVSRH